MVKTTQSYFVYHAQAALHSLNLLCRKPLATLMTVIVIAIALALPALFWVFTDNLGQLTIGWQRGGQISLYMKPLSTEAEQTALLQKVKATNGVGQAALTTAADGLAELTQQEGMQDIMRYLPDNPLPAVIEVVPSLVVDSPAKLDTLFRQLQALPLVDQAKLDMQWISKLNSIAGFVAKFVKVLMALLSLAIILIIGTTLRLVIHSRHEEIQVLKLIGATDSFILRPFLYSGIWYGVAGAIIAVLMVNIAILSVGVAVNRLAETYQMHYPLTGLSLRQVIVLVLFSTLLGWLGARMSVKRQLYFIEPYN